MLALTFALCLAAAPDTIIFDDGGLHVLSPADIGPNDDLIVRGHPTIGTTIVRFEANVVLRSITSESRGWTRTLGPITVLDSVAVERDGESTFLFESFVNGPTTVHEGGTLISNLGATLSDVTVLGAADVTLGGTVRGDVDTASSTRLFGTFEGPVTLRGSGTMIATGADFLDSIVGTGDIHLRLNQSTAGGQVTLQDDAHMQLGRLNSIHAITQLEDSASVTIPALEANVPFGEVLGSSGVLIGLGLEEFPFSFGFTRAPGASVQVQQATWWFGEPFCPQDEPSSTGQFTSMVASGSRRATADDVVLRLDGLPNHSFVLFIVGDGQRSTALQGGRICVGGNVGRYVAPGQIKNSGVNDFVELHAPIQPIPGNPATFATSGQSFYFQGWYRDVTATGSWRFSEGLGITFL